LLGLISRVSEAMGRWEVAGGAMSPHLRRESRIRMIQALLKAAEKTPPLAPKTTIARELLLQPGLHFSVQVLREFIVNARHPQKLNLPQEREQRWLQGWLLRPAASLTTATFLRALAIHTRYLCG
jgi:hypothetical protein